jgi:DNA polymerase III subunit delta'
MSFASFTEHTSGLTLLQRSLDRGRLGHAYLLTGSRHPTLEALARTLAKTLNCQAPKSGREQGGLPDCCDVCPACRQIDNDLHPDVTWIRPESRSRVIKVEQMRELMRVVNLKPTQAPCKVGIIAAADRLNENSANAFLKTLEEPPPNSLLILLTTNPAALLETVLSRCLRLNLTEEERPNDPETLAWLGAFTESALRDQGSLLSRYRLLSVLLQKLAQIRQQVTEKLEAASPLERYEDVEPELRERWEDELKAAVEAEYRRRRAELLTGLQWWLRDVWLLALASAPPDQPPKSAEPLENPRSELELAGGWAFPHLEMASKGVAQRVPLRAAMENLRIMERTLWLLDTNIQEALALETGLLKLRL